MKKPAPAKKPKKAAKRTRKPDASQSALSVVERAIGGKLGEGMNHAK